MNVTPSTFTLTQMILAWTLLGLLVSWLIIFSVLSLRVFIKKYAEFEDLPTPSRPLPAISTQPSDTHQRFVGIVTGDMLPDDTRSESSRDMGTTPMK